MPVYLENFDLDFFQEDEEAYTGLMGMVAQDGVGIKGYYGLPYLNRHFGEVQLILRTSHNPNGEGLMGEGLDTHASGRAVWTVRIHEMSIDRKESDLLSKRVVVSRADGSGGMAVVNIVNADVLPSYIKDDIVKMQMIAFPGHIEYYADEDAYAESQPKSKTGKKFMLGDGTVFPTGMMRNRSPESDEFESDEDLDDICGVRGTVKALYWGKFEMGGDENNTFIRCIIDTEFGPLDVVHTVEQVDETMRENLKVGATVVFSGVISGDVAIYEYDKGIIRDEEHNLAALRNVFYGGDPERVRSILTEHSQYIAGYNKTSYTGADEIIDRLKWVQKDHDGEYFAHMATIVSIDEGEAPVEYEVGKRCVIIASGEENKYESIAFIEQDEEGNVAKLITTANPRYRFSIDAKPKYKNPLEDYEMPTTFITPMISRARFHGIVSNEVADEDITRESEHILQYENNAIQMLEVLPNNEGADKETNLENLFGYLFAKAVEAKYFNDNPINDGCLTKLVCRYTPADVWEGVISSNLDSERHTKLEAAMSLGKQFYKDFKFVQEKMDDDYEDNLRKALLLVQNLGEIYSDKCLG